MEWVPVLALVFALSTAILAVVLFRHIRAGKHPASKTPLPNRDLLDEIARKNLFEGSIRDVAKAASDMLVESFGCDRILYLRYHRGRLQVNFHHRLTEFQRSTFRFRPKQALLDRLVSAPGLTDLSALEQLLPPNVVSELTARDLTIVVPICWRENLYGLYFLSFPHELRPSQRALLFNVVAQSVASAYHVRWHEYKLDAATRKIEQLCERFERDIGAAERTRRMILTLMRRPEPGRVITGLFERLCSDLEFTSAVLYVLDPATEPNSRAIYWGLDRTLPQPTSNDIVKLCEELSMDGSRRLDDMACEIEQPDLFGSLAESGLTRLARLSLPNDRTAVMAFATRRDITAVDTRLAELREDTHAIVRNADSFRRLQQMSCSDSLTELPNRRYFIRRLAEEVKRARRFTRTLTLVFLDVDCLKQINDSYGHLAGDAVLKGLSRVISSTIRTIDVLCRYGGDEFCIIMPETDRHHCEQFLERLSETIEGQRLGPRGIPEEICCTVSMGAAIFPDHAEDPRGLLEAADAALLKSKAAGRNTYRIYGPAAVWKPDRNS